MALNSSAVVLGVTALESAIDQTTRRLPVWSTAAVTSRFRPRLAGRVTGADQALPWRFETRMVSPSWGPLGSASFDQAAKMLPAPSLASTGAPSWKRSEAMPG